MKNAKTQIHIKFNRHVVEKAIGKAKKHSSRWIEGKKDKYIDKYKEGI